MATGQTIIDRALRLIGAIASGASPTSQETADGLIALNAMIESWQAEKLNVYAFLDSTVAITPNDASYNIGPTGDIVLTPRPASLANCFVRASNIDYSVELVTKDRWFAISDKTVTSDIPQLGYYDPKMTNGVLLLWPVPTAANTLHVVTWTTVVTLAAASTSISLPQGYERALAYNLAIELAPEYGKEPSQAVVSSAREAKAIIKRANIRPTIADTGLYGFMKSGRTDIYSGE